MKASLFLFVLVFLSACGNNQSPVSVEKQQTPVTAPECHISFDRSDTLEIIAQKSNRMRIECKLSEEEVVKLVESM
jgi:hypothetical protein